jgi:hypothetical protein
MKPFTFIAASIVLCIIACSEEHKETINKKVDTVTSKPTKSIITTIEKLTIVPVIPKGSCIAVVKEIVLTSPRYKEVTKGLNEAIVKNGGQSFGVSLEKSPHPKKDKAWGFSKTYDFVIYEKYADRQLNTVRFRFDPRTKQLREYDPILDAYKPIAFNKKLLLQYDSVFVLTQSIENKAKSDLNN